MVGDILGEKLYKVKTKEGTHISEKVNDDGSRAALQFDEENGLQGPVDLIEVDEDEYTQTVYVEVERKERTLGEQIIEDVIAPAIADSFAEIAGRAIDAGISALEDVMTQKVIPAVKRKGTELIDKVKHVQTEKKNIKTHESSALATKQTTRLSAQKIAEQDEEQEKIVHTVDEVNQIANNMRIAAMYIAAGIRELSNTVIAEDGSSPEQRLQMQKKLDELSAEQFTDAINYMLEDRNREALDQATLQMFEAFRERKLIVNGEAIPISKYIGAE